MWRGRTSTPLSYYNVTATLWGYSGQPLESLLGVILVPLPKAISTAEENGSTVPQAEGQALDFVDKSVDWNPEIPPVTLENQGRVAERVGFKPTVRLPVQRFSSSKIFVPAVPGSS